MKKLLLYLFIIPLSLISQTTAIPDTIFEQALINLGYDNGTPDGTVPTSNISSVVMLNVSSLSIADLTGIEGFIALNTLYCYGNQISSLDLRQNINLIDVDCSGNPLISLIITDLNSLLWLYCDFCQLDTLDVSTNINIEELDFEVNQITSIDLSNNIALESLYCTYNSLKSLDVSKNINLTFLQCNYNDSLTCLNLQNGNNQYMGANGLIACFNQNLSCIDVDDSLWAATNWIPPFAIDAGMTFDTNCNNACSPIIPPPTTTVKVNKDVLISLYPNPSNNIITINLGDYSFGKIVFFNLLGEEIIYQNIKNSNKIIFDLTKLRAKGTYFMRFYNEKNVPIASSTVIYN
jgi:hypothetical protein